MENSAIKESVLDYRQQRSTFDGKTFLDRQSLLKELVSWVPPWTLDNKG
jgi:hypothetical protein